jgi:hypothetical protein
MSTCNRLDLQTLGSPLIMLPKNLPNHGAQVVLLNSKPSQRALKLRLAHPSEHDFFATTLANSGPSLDYREEVHW